jgi:folate-binding Fe-S cluster repair protein YgfZ
VARVQHRGKIKQRMYQLEIQTDDFVSPQVEVRNIDKKVGSVVISSLKDSFCYGLAVINISDVDKNLSINGCKVNLNKLV